MAEAPPYEAYVRQNPERILQEASEFFMQRGNVYQALRELAGRLEEAAFLMPCWTQSPWASMGCLG